MYKNAATAYKNTNISTASPEELTLMLYDGMVKFCNMAILALEKNDYEGCHKNITKTKKIIVELRSTLDFRYEVSKDFDRIYDYIHWVLTQANVKKDKALIENGLKQIRDMRDIWRELMKQEKEEKVRQAEEAAAKKLKQAQADVAAAAEKKK